MSCKQKYSSDGQDEAIPTKNSTCQPVCDQKVGSQTKPDSSLEWTERKSQLVYDFSEGSLDPRRLRATNYKFNRSTNLPKPCSASVEAKHELRKSEALHVFDKTVSINPKSNSKVPYASKSNLNPNELKGLKSLQKKVADGNLVVCELDKSAKLCVLTRDQYLAAGYEHCKDDLEVSATDVKRLQKYVNAHVEWLHEIFDTGSFWNHEDRIISSSRDEGSQVAPLRLLLKDHKAWDPNSGKVIPSRPVVNGSAGFNCHLSEILSLILGPVAKEASGSEINSTGDLLSLIDDVNKQISQNDGSSSFSTTNKQTTADSCFPADDSMYCDHCTKCNSTSPSASELKRVKTLIDRTCNKKVNSAMNVSNVLRQKLKASREATKLYHRCWIKPQKSAGSSLCDPVVNENATEAPSLNADLLINKVCPSDPDYALSFPLSESHAEPHYIEETVENSLTDKNIPESLMVTGFDVQSLYPSLRDVDTAAIARESILHSDLDFRGLEVQKALVYLRIVAGEQAMKDAGLGNFVPRWCGDKVEALRVTGTAGKNMDSWKFNAQTPSIMQIKQIIGLLVEVGVIIAMGSHVYEFGGKLYLQLWGGPIGSTLTAWLASIVMKAFDNLWESLLIANHILYLAYARYVDVSRTFMNGIRKGWRWVEDKFEFDSSWESQDIVENLPDDARTVSILVQAMNSIMPFLSFTGEAPSDFPDMRLPTLDCSIFVCNNKFLFSFFEKPMRSDTSIDANTALPANTIKSSLRQEIVRRLTNIHLEVEFSERIKVLDLFYDKLAKSGHCHKNIQLLFFEAIAKFNSLVDRSLLPSDHPSYRPLYLSNDYDRVNRGIRKFLLQFNWYNPSNDPLAHDWKLQIPDYLKPESSFKGKFKQSSSKIPCTSVLFVPNSNNGTLIKRLEQKEPMLTRLSGFKVRLVESSGVALSRLFSIDLSDGLCHRFDCAVCRFHNGKSGSKCKKKSIVYESRCLACPKSNQVVYVGESGRSLYERALEHLEDAENKKSSSHIFKHWAIAHADLDVQPEFKFSVLRTHRAPLDRQLHEAVRISTHGQLNSKAEFRQNQIKRLSVQLTARELKAVEKELTREDLVTKAAVDSLTCRLKLNKSNISVPCKPLPDTSSISDQAFDAQLFTDIPVKRKLSCDSVANKRLNMGRRSSGNTANESKNFVKFMPNWLDSWDKPEILRSPRTPATFAEASLLAKY